MKILGCFRSAQGARDSATLRGVLLTARKQGRNRIEASLQGPEELPGNLRDASRRRREAGDRRRRHSREQLPRMAFGSMPSGPSGRCLVACRMQDPGSYYSRGGPGCLSRT